MNVPNGLGPEQGNNTIGNVVSLDIRLEPTLAKDPHIEVGVFDVVISGPDGKDLGVHLLEVMYPKYQDVVDVIAYYEDRGQLYICTDTRIRPVLATRSQLKPGEKLDFRLRDGLYTIFDQSKGDICFADAVHRSIEQRTNVKTQENTKIQIGSSYFPAIGASAEVAVSCYVDLGDPSHKSDFLIHGSNFDAEHVIEYQTPQSIVDSFCAGETGDMRLLLHALELARKHHIDIRMPSVIQQLVLQGQYDHLDPKSSSIPMIGGKDAQTYIDDIIKAQSEYHINLVECDREAQFIKTMQAHVVQSGVDDRSDEYDVQFGVRSGIDTTDVGSFFWSDGKLYLIAKLSVRPALQARQYKPHHIALGGSISNLEGISGMGSHDPVSQASQIAHTKIGSYPINKQQYIGSYYPSPGNNPEKTDLVLQSIDPTQGDSAEWKEFDVVDTPIMAIEVDTLLSLYEQNIIKDPRLVVTANLLKQASGYKNLIDQPIETVKQSDLDRFYEALNTPLQIDSFYKDSAKELKDSSLYDLHILFKRQSAWYRKVMSYVEQELGGFFATRDWLLSDTDMSFFDAAIPAFAVPGPELAAKYQNYAMHDSGHYVQGTVVPTPDMSKETYVRLMSKTEALAVFDSDYRYPKEVGLDVFEKTIGGHKSIARSFDNLGITDPDEVKSVILSIEVDGIIPKKILSHPNYLEEKANIVDRLLRFHVMDNTQASAQYDQWMKNQEVAKIMLQFGNCVGSEEEFEDKMANYESVVNQYSEGVNQIKSYVNRVLTKHITMPAIRLGVIRQMLVDNGCDSDNLSMQKVDQFLARFQLYRSRIVEISNSVTGIEAQAHNIKAVRDADIIRGEIDVLTESIAILISQSENLTIDQKTKLQSSQIPYFTGFAPMPENLMNLVHDLEKSQMANL